MDFLVRIIDRKKHRLEEAKRVVSLDRLRAFAFEKRGSHKFRGALENQSRINVIAEFKRRSPSKGVIRANADPGEIGRLYEAGGAVAVSVLTEEDFFDGSLEDLKTVNQNVSIPVLRKDFVFDEYQVYEAAANGADAVLLIVAALDDQTLLRLRCVAEDELQLDALIEVHTVEEIKRAGEVGASVIGVNNRNLSTFEVSLDTSIKLANNAPPYSVLVSESGLNTRDDLTQLRDAGFSAFLIGESLMRSDDPVHMLRRLTSPN
ncbi:MAG: indole-3-glycerol phosphate synthase TrpC [Blastocatellia bacterium]|nr:MAG: indole-3-glycerol phosphate synthase TrpC [Blastocatellia bacterium]